MICPLCQETLQMMERQGVEIDYCPKCRGVWLDRGELQKLIDISIAQQAAVPVVGHAAPVQAVPRVIPTHLPSPSPHHPGQASMPHTEWEHTRRYEENRRQDGYYGRHKKRESWLGELFDWD